MKDTLGRRGGHEDREKAGTTGELFVLWAGAGFSWESRTGGAQWGRSGETPRRGAVRVNPRGVRGMGEGQAFGFKN